VKLLIHMNMPSGKNDGTHQVILDVPDMKTLNDVSYLIGQGYLLGDHLVYERADNNTRTWASRGPLVVNWEHIGKVAEYYEGKS